MKNNREICFYFKIKKKKHYAILPKNEKKESKKNGEVERKKEKKQKNKERKKS